MKQYKVLLAGVATRFCKLEVSLEAGKMRMHPLDAHPLLRCCPDAVGWDGKCKVHMHSYMTLNYV
jgi:hypothetical protein